MYVQYTKHCSTTVGDFLLELSRSGRRKNMEKAKLLGIAKKKKFSLNLIYGVGNIVCNTFEKVYIYQVNLH